MGGVNQRDGLRRGRSKGWIGAADIFLALPHGKATPCDEVHYARRMRPAHPISVQ